jgi:phosphatidylglycerophosphate synthase
MLTRLEAAPSLSRTTAAPGSRRPLATRNAPWARTLAHQLGRAGVRPNAVSLASIAFAGAACASCSVLPNVGTNARLVLLVIAAACVQLRLLCNLLDGMLAIEERLSSWVPVSAGSWVPASAGSWVPASAGTLTRERRSGSGEIYNELPDRLADVLILVGAGYGARTLPYGVALGWTAAVLALLTAYVRTLGASLGLSQSFAGPMAKQHRMFTLTLAALASVPEALFDRPPHVLHAALLIIVVGSAVTVARRTRLLLREVDTR